MQLDVVTTELREIAHRIIAPGIGEDAKARLVGRFHELYSTKKGLLREERPGCVYFVHAPSAEMVKIGTTASLELRLTGLRMSSPVPLILLGAIPGGAAKEGALHSRWARLRQHGEWFRASPELLREIELEIAA